MNSITRISFIAFALVGSSVEAQNIILNGGFESPVIPSNSRQLLVPTSWTGGPFTVIVNGNGSVAELPMPLEGHQYVAVATSETLSQVFTVATATGHRLQWFDGTAHEPGLTSVPYKVDVLSETSQVVATASLDAFHPEDWIERSLSMDLTPGNYTLRFKATGALGPGGNSPLFDSVSLLVPEPCTISLFFAAALMVFRYRIPRL